MNYKVNKNLLMKPLSKEEHDRIIKELKKEMKKIDKRLAESPCYYQGCELWYDCKRCKGFKEDCSARLPECILKDKNGNWNDSDP